MKFRSAFALTFLLCPAIERFHADIFAWTYTTDLDGVLEWFTGASYRLARSWSAGLEFWNHHEFADATVHEHSAYFVGPTIHYEGQCWFATLGFLRQLPIGQAFSHENKEFAAHDSYILGDEHEKYYVPLRVGFDFNTHRNWHFASSYEWRISGCALAPPVASSRSRSGSSRPREFLLWQIQQN